MKYRLITDVTADLTPEMTAGLPETAILPMDIVLDGTPYRYGPGGDITVEQFYAELRSGKFSTTSQVNLFRYEEFFTPFLEAGEDILYLCFTSGMSGMYQNAEHCAAQLRKKYPERKIYCVDTRCASLGEGFLVREAMIRKAQGASIEELARWVDEAKEKVCQWFTVDTFEHLRQGGRVSSAAAVVGTVLQIKPLLHVSAQGELEVMDRTVRGTKRAMAALLERLKDGWAPEECRRVFVGHSDCPEVAEELAWRIRGEYPDADVYIAPIGPVIGSHTGPGMLGLVFWGTKR